MSAPQDTDQMLTDWLEAEAAGAAPDRLFDVVLATTAQMRQARRFPWWIGGPAATLVSHRLSLVVVLVVLAAVVGAVAIGGGARNARVPAASPPALTARSVVATPVAATCAHPHAIAVADGGIWVSCLEQSRRYDASTGHLTGAVEAPIVAADAAGALAATSGAVESLDPRTGAPHQSTPVSGAVALALDGKAAWVAQGDDHLLARIDRATMTLGRPISLPSRPGPLVAGAGSVWVTLPDRNQVIGIDPATGTTSRSFAVAEPAQLAFAAGRLWVLDSAGTTLTTLDPGSGTAVSRPFVPIGPGTSPVAPGVPAAGFAVVGTTVWEVAGTQLVATDGQTGVVQQLLRVDSPAVALVAIASDGGSLLVIDSDGTRLLRINP